MSAVWVPVAGNNCMGTKAFPVGSVAVLVTSELASTVNPIVVPFILRIRSFVKLVVAAIVVSMRVWALAARMTPNQLVSVLKRSK